MTDSINTTQCYSLSGRHGVQGSFQAHGGTLYSLQWEFSRITPGKPVNGWEARMPAALNKAVNR